MNDSVANSIATPTRHANPFATCWIRPGAIPFRFPAGECAEQLIARLAVNGWRGAIIGPHGSGKSTLLESLKPALAATGRLAHSFALHNHQRCLPRDVWTAIRAIPASGANSSAQILIIDGYEQLGWLERSRLTRFCNRAGAGLLATSHAPIHLPTLIRLRPDRALVETIVAELCGGVSTAVTLADIAASHACHGSNVREILFDLYDRHELGRRALRRAANLAAVAT